MLYQDSQRVLPEYISFIPHLSHLDQVSKESSALSRTKGAPWTKLLPPPVSFDQAFPSATMTLVNFHIVSGGAAPWTKLSPPVSFRSSVNSHIVKKWVFERERERGRGRGERERVAPPVTFRSSKISHTLKMGLNEYFRGAQPHHATI